MKILHVLDHSLPLHSGYTFRTAADPARAARAGLGDAPPDDAAPRRVDGGRRAGRWLGVPPDADATATAATAACRWSVPISTKWRRRASGCVQLVRAHRPDVIHAHSPVLNVLPALAVGQARRRAGRLRDPRLLGRRRGRPRDRPPRAACATERRARSRPTPLRRVQGVAVICEGLRRDVEARGIPRERITVIPECGRCRPVRVRRAAGCRAAAASSAWRARRFSASSAPSMPMRGWTSCSSAARAAPAAQSRTCACCSRVADRRRPRSKARARRSSASLMPSCSPGGFRTSQVARYYSLVDVLVYPRRSMRLTDLVTPLKPLEAMALGRIVVASRRGRTSRTDRRTGRPDSCSRRAMRGARRAPAPGPFATRDRWECHAVNARAASWKRSAAGRRSVAALRAALRAGLRP